MESDYVMVPAWVHEAALQVARRFTLDTETQRRAQLQCAVRDAMMSMRPARPDPLWPPEAPNSPEMRALTAMIGATKDAGMDPFRMRQAMIWWLTR